jgi:hypothetical protein
MRALRKDDIENAQLRALTFLIATVMGEQVRETSLELSAALVRLRGTDRATRKRKAQHPQGGPVWREYGFPDIRKDFSASLIHTGFTAPGSVVEGGNI